MGVQTDTARNIHRSDHTERRLPTAPRGCCVRKATGTGANEQRGPLLLIAGGEDHVVPAAVDAQAAKKYGKSRAVTDFKEFPGRSHTASWAAAAGKRSPTTPSTGPSAAPVWIGPFAGWKSQAAFAGV